MKKIIILLVLIIFVLDVQSQTIFYKERNKDSYVVVYPYNNGIWIAYNPKEQALKEDLRKNPKYYDKLAQKRIVTFGSFNFSDLRYSTAILNYKSTNSGYHFYELVDAIGAIWCITIKTDWNILINDPMGNETIFDKVNPSTLMFDGSKY